MVGKFMNGYKLDGDFQGKDAGFSRWTFAQKYGQEYFLKEFFDPVYPDEKTVAPGFYRSRVAECQRYEKRKVALYHAINQVSDGNVVRIAEFFRHSSHYYLVTGKLCGEKLSCQQISQLPLEDKLLICRTAAHALMKVHEAGIVHSDIKESNFMLQRSANGRLVAKLFDFDASFFAADPPEDPEELNFDQVYLAPEGCLFVLGHEVQLSTKMDVFSLGLLLHQYLTGALPAFDTSRFGLAHEALLEGASLELDPGLPLFLRNILQGMLEVDPEKRSSMDMVFHALDRSFLPPEPSAPPAPPVPSSGSNPWYAGGEL